MQLLPLGLLVVAVGFTIHSAYLYWTSAEGEVLWLLFGVGAVLYFSIRSWLAAKQVFVIGE